MQRPCVTPPLGSFAAAGFACFLLAACGSPAGRGPSPADETARAQNQAGTRSLASGNLTGALAQYRSSLAVAESVENFELAGANLLNIAVVHERLGQWNESHAAADKILSAPLLYGSQTVTGAAARKAFVHLDQGDATAALRWADAAERDCAPPCSPLAALENLRAHIALEHGQTDKAIAHASRAAGLSTAPAMEAELANAQRLLGRAFTRANQFVDSAQSLTSALVIDRRLGLTARIALDLLYAGDNEMRRNEKAGARHFYERAAAVSAAAYDEPGVRAARQRLEVLTQ